MGGRRRSRCRAPASWTPPWPRPTWSIVLQATPGVRRRPAGAPRPAAVRHPRQTIAEHGAERVEGAVTRNSRNRAQMRDCVVCTVVHHPEDARILAPADPRAARRGARRHLHRPGSARAICPPMGATSAPDRRFRAPWAAGGSARLRAARRVLARHARRTPTWCSSTTRSCCWRCRRGGRGRRTVWDVHEDTAAALGAKGWLPRPLRPPLRAGRTPSSGGRSEACSCSWPRRATGRGSAGTHPVVPNTTYVPDVARRTRRAPTAGRLRRPAVPGPRRGRDDHAGRGCCARTASRST